MVITEIEDKIQNIIDKEDENNFLYDFLGVYDIPKATITKLKKEINNLSTVDGEIYLKNKIYFKQTTDNLMQTFTDIKEKVDNLGTKPRYIFITNFKDVLAYDTKNHDTLSIPFEKLPQKFEFFLAWNGIEKADFDKENPADIRAAERFAKLYDVIVKDNPNVSRKGLNLFLIRVLFCLFAEDTDIFEKNQFTNQLKQLTSLDGSDVDEFISKLFGILDVKEEERHADIPSWLNDFPYVDGDLFIEPHESLKFTAKSRKLIIDAGEKLEWDQINPDILGSMLQAVASEDSRSHLGMHYTSVSNIMKVIKPLFLDDLREEFEKAKGNFKKLAALYERIGNIKFMDPACGSGNFLIVTYKQLRQLEIDILKEQNKIAMEKGTGEAVMYIPSVTLDQFYGIEIEDFACDTTRLSLWIAEHQMNVKLRKEIQDAVRPTLPLQHAGAIVCGNALRLDWEEILPHKKDDEVYLFGNPPYYGHSKQSKLQKQEIRDLFKEVSGNGYLDYICGWFKLGANYIGGTKSRLAFVTTDSISEGEQVAILWNNLLKMCSISFAYTPFKWKNNAKNNAGVFVEIIGLISKTNKQEKRIYSGEQCKYVNNISPYITEGTNITIAATPDNLSGLPKMYFGSKPTDGGGLLFSFDEYKQAITDFPKLSQYLKKFVGSNDFINSKKRFVLWLNESDYNDIKDNPLVKQRINIVRNKRLESGTKSTNKWAEKPYMFKQISPIYKNSKNIKGGLIIPRVSSSNRLYIPMGIVEPNTIVSDLAMTVYNGPLWLLGLLQSHMHMVWLSHVGGRLGTGYRYSTDLVYNTFFVPQLSSRRKNEIEDLVLKILDIREEEPGTLSELYGSPLAEKNPKPMNSRLLKAHQELDKVVDRAYKASDFKDDNERLELLLDMYSKKVKELNDK